MMNYHHRFSGGQQCDLPIGKIVCVGRNYTAHALELNNPIPQSPLLFIKPATSLTHLAPSFVIPTNRGEVHHELEMALLIGERLTNASSNETIAAIFGVGLALDLTLRDIQSELKAKAQPWEIAKSFDGACPVSDFVKLNIIDNIQSCDLLLEKNGVIQQQGTTSDMLFPIADLLAVISESFSLMPGDIVLTGTPAGVGPLARGDKLVAKLNDLLVVSTTVS
ncbi:MAG: 2-keto-4-pentenoate hydratase/2-oxohepta-3-ene-1,7-dioic acid hydratase in catechol pathway [Pseudomonadales bacterium]|jgi:2-keto-4-pentenoate hydratase/2-oxohepta-3-ene-1,7-dioic acid hydratase in catechol pathway